jgi:phenolic acid decarboxylase
MNAVMMRGITDKACQLCKARVKAEVNARRLRDFGAIQLFWWTKEVPRIVEAAQREAEKGWRVYREFNDVWPADVIEHFKMLGFEVEVSVNKRWGRRIGTETKCWAHTMTLRW